MEKENEFLRLNDQREMTKFSHMNSQVKGKKLLMLKMALRVKTVHFPCLTVVSQLSLQSDWVAGRRDHLSLPQTDFNLLQCYAPPK